MLNWAARYFPILRILRKRVAAGELLLDVGSGSFGLAAFYRQRFVGCDLVFPQAPQSPMLPVCCSATALPFSDSAFTAVVVSDVLEHVPPAYRGKVVNEVLRVARDTAVFGFPSGEPAQECDRRFDEILKRRGLPSPEWLEEHLLYTYPDRTLFEGIDPEWCVESFGNEHVGFHDWVNRSELSRIRKGIFWMVLTIAPWAGAALLRLADRPPFYRLIVVATRKARARGDSAC